MQCDKMKRWITLCYEALQTQYYGQGYPENNILVIVERSPLCVFGVRFHFVLHSVL
jgi:hypothetical protein